MRERVTGTWACARRGQWSAQVRRADRPLCGPRHAGHASSGECGGLTGRTRHSRAGRESANPWVALRQRSPCPRRAKSSPSHWHRTGTSPPQRALPVRSAPGCLSGVHCRGRAHGVFIRGEVPLRGVHRTQQCHVAREALPAARPSVDGAASSTSMEGPGGRRGCCHRHSTCPSRRRPSTWAWERLL